MGSTALTTTPATDGPWPTPTPEPGDAVAIAEYLGRNEDFENALTAFSASYAEQNQRDHEAFVAAVANGRIAAVEASSAGRPRRAR